MLTYLFESSICLAGFYLVYDFTLKKHSAHRINRFYILSSILLSLIIPLLQFTIEVEPTIVQTNDGLNSSSLRSEHNHYSLIPTIFGLLYLVGTFISLTILAYKLFSLWQIIRKGRMVKKDGYNLVYIRESIGFCSFFNFILIPENHKSLNEYEESHELCHIKQRHTYDTIFMGVIASLYWFNPVIYFFKKRLTEVHEFLADEGTIELHGKSNYQQFILNQISRKITSRQLVHNFNSIIKTRLNMMNSNSKPKSLSYIAWMGTTLSLFFFFSCQKQATAQVVHTKSDQAWRTETVIDTVIVIDADTYEEEIRFERTLVEYKLDTVVVFDPKTLEEKVSIVKTYKDIRRNPKRNRKD